MVVGELCFRDEGYVMSILVSFLYSALTPVRSSLHQSCTPRDQEESSSVYCQAKRGGEEVERE